jgi:Domain of Unknown Function (DUF748)
MEGQSQGEWRRTKRVKSRKWLWILAGGLVVVVLAVLLTPVYLSSNGFKRMIQTKIGRSTGGTAAIGDLTVGWLKGVRISEFSFRDKAGWVSVSIGGIDTQPRLRALLGGTLSLGQTVIDKPKIEIDLRNQPIPTTAAAAAAKEANTRKTSAPPTSFSLISDVTINDGSIHLTDRTGKTVQVANLNSQLNVRRPGEPSTVEVDMVIADAGEEATVRTSGTVTPAKSTGWTLKGTSGDVVVEVNDLKLDSLAPFFDLAGVELQATGRISADMKATVQDGKLETVTATIAGQDLDIGGAALKGDRFHTSRLDVRTKLTQDDQTIRIEQLEARTDWATVKAAGTLPTTVKSMADLLQSDTAYDLQGDFDCELPALLSQMPNTFALKEGTQITAGRANGTISTITQNGRATIVAQTKVVGLAGNVDGKELTLTEPVVVDLRLSADEKKTQLEALNISSAFAKIDASGDLEQIRYDAQIDLTTLQSELGQFANLGPYQMAGAVSSKGQISIQDSNVVAIGSAAVSQLVLASADGNSVSEPQANVDFAVNMDKTKQALAIDYVDIQGGFGSLSARNGMVPTSATSAVPMEVDVVARDLDLAKLKPYAVLFASFPKKTELAGVAQSQVAVTAEKGKYRFQTADTKIRNLKFVTPGKEPFEQKEVTLRFDAEIYPSTKEYELNELELNGEGIKIKGRFEKTQQGNNASVDGSLEGECDWAAVGPLASGFLPAGLKLTGQRPLALNFASTYPADDPNLLLANLDATTLSGFDSASYKGLNVGPTNLDVRIENGLMTITPFTTTVNNGELNFSAQADFKEKARSLRTPKPMMLAKGIQLNKEMTAQMLQYVNPLFANVTGISGIANFECERLSIPLAAGMGKEAEVVGTISADNILLEASGLLDQILKATGQSLRGQRLAIRPTRISLQNGTMQYDNMQIDIGDNPLTFGGTIGLNGQLDMTVTLPWTLKGRTARVDRGDRAGPRVEVSLGGTITKPKLDLGKLLQDQIFRGLESLF